MGKRYEGRPFAAGLNSGLTIVMFGTGPETIDYAILYFDTNTSMPYILEVMDRAMLDALHHWFNFSFRATTT